MALGGFNKNDQAEETVIGHTSPPEMGDRF